MNTYLCWFADTPEFKQDYLCENSEEAALHFCSLWNEQDATVDLPEPYLIEIVVQDITNWLAPETITIQGVLSWQYQLYEE